jgi:hypothetical protein
MRIHRPHRRGFFFFEMLVFLMLASAFVLVAMRLFCAAVRISHAAGEAHSTAARFDSAIHSLRSDIWSGRNVVVSDEHTAAITGPDDTAIQWTIERNGTMVRVERRGAVSRRQQWSECAPGTMLGLDGVELVIRIPDTHGARGGEVRLVGQIELTRRITR